MRALCDHSRPIQIQCPFCRPLFRSCSVHQSIYRISQSLLLVATPLHRLPPVHHPLLLTSFNPFLKNLVFYLAQVENEEFLHMFHLEEALHLLTESTNRGQDVPFLQGSIQLWAGARQAITARNSRYAGP